MHHLQSIAEISETTTRASLLRRLALDGYGLKASERAICDMIALGFLEKINENEFRVLP